MISRRRFLFSASAAAAAAVVKANIPATAIEPGSYLAEQPSWVPKGYLYPDGRTVLRSDYPQLFAAIGNTFGSNGPLTFRLPDFRKEETTDTHFVISTEYQIYNPAGSIVALFRRKYVG